MSKSKYLFFFLSLLSLSISSTATDCSNVKPSVADDCKKILIDSTKTEDFYCCYISGKYKDGSDFKNCTQTTGTAYDMGTTKLKDNLKVTYENINTVESYDCEAKYIKAICFILYLGIVVLF